jgi:hypothetical protein
MADHILFVGFSNPVRGAEQRAFESLNEAMGMLGRMQEDGRIEGFDVAMLEPNTDLGGFVTIRGTAEQIAALRTNEEFQRKSITGQLAFEGTRHIEGYANEGLVKQLAMYREAIAKLPQPA